MQVWVWSILQNKNWDWHFYERRIYVLHSRRSLLSKHLLKVPYYLIFNVQ